MPAGARSTPAGASNGWRFRLQPGASPPEFHDGDPGARPSRPVRGACGVRSRSDSADSSSLHDQDGLLNPIPTIIEHMCCEHKFDHHESW